MNERWKCEAFENENQELRKTSQQFSHLQMKANHTKEEIEGRGEALSQEESGLEG